MSAEDSRVDVSPADAPAARSDGSSGFDDSVLTRILKGAGSDALKYFPVRFIPALTSILTVPLFTRLIDSTDYGYFYLITSAATFLASIATAWLSSSAIRFYWAARKEERVDDYIATVVWSTVASLAVMSILVGIGVASFSGAMDPGLRRLLLAGIAYFFLSNLFKTMLQVLRAANRASAFAVLSIADTLVTTALSVAFVWPMRLGSLGILSGVALGTALLLIPMLRAVGREGSLGPSSYSKGMMREFLSYGVPLIPVGISSWVLVLADRYMIGLLRNASEVGLYSVAYGLGDKLMQLIALPLIMTMTPILMETYERRGQAIAERVQTQFTRYALMVTIPLLAGMTATSDLFMRAFTAEEYRQAAYVLPIVSAAALLSSLAQLAGIGLGLHKRSVIIMRNTLTAAAVNIGANAVLIPRFGYAAAAWTTVASYGVLLLLTWLRSRPYMPWRFPFSAVARIIAASLAMAFAVRALAFLSLAALPTLLLSLIAGVLIYAVVLLAVGGVRRDELAYARKIISGLFGRLGHPLRTFGGGRR